MTKIENIDRRTFSFCAPLYSKLPKTKFFKQRYVVSLLAAVVVSFSVGQSFAVEGQSPEVASSIPAETPDAKEQTADRADAVKSEEMSYYLLSQTTRSFLELLARDADVLLHIEDGVRGTLTRARFDGTIEKILDDVTQASQLQWFVFEDKYYVSPRRTASTRLTRLGDISYSTAMDALTDAGLVFEDFPTASTSNGASIAISGPPRYIAYAESVIEAIPSPVAAASPAPLPQAAEDYIVVRRGLEITREPVGYRSDY
ncbi:MAG: hypothetical protein WBG95_05200 [Sulfitobacter sp.]